MKLITPFATAYTALLLLFSLTLLPTTSNAQSDVSSGGYGEYGDFRDDQHEYDDRSNSDDSYVERSPKQGWEALPTEKKSKATVLEQVVMWVPNRFLDFLDIFRVDVGVGPSIGAVVRITEYGQVGFRAMVPASARAGIFGRELPLRLETEGEYGIGPWYSKSPNRPLCEDIIGAGVDVVLLGLHLGICPTELVDFLGGIVFEDLKNDDWRATD